jgi:hypothetical protein
MVNVDSELKAYLLQSFDERVELRKAMINKNPGKNQKDKPMSEETRLLQNAYRTMKRDKIDIPTEWEVTDEFEMEKETFGYQRSRKERQIDQEIIQIYRERHKQQTIIQKLKEQLTTKYPIEISFGQAKFFEFIFQNPYIYDQNFEICWNDDELR